MLLFLFLPFFAGAQSDSLCPILLGGNTYINCSHMIVYNGNDLLSLKPGKGMLKGISFKLFNNDGSVYASIVEGLPSGDWSRFIIESNDHLYHIKDASSGITILKIVQPVDEAKCAWNVWAQLTLPSGQLVQITPENSNLPQLQYMRGNSFRNMGSAIIIDE